MPIRPRSVRPWADHVSPFSPEFRNLINAALEELVSLIKIREPIQRVIKEGKSRRPSGDISTVVRAVITVVGPGTFNVTYSAESPDTVYTIEDATPTNRWANYAYNPAAVDDDCLMLVQPGSGEVVALVVWETPDDKICAVPPTVPV